MNLQSPHEVKNKTKSFLSFNFIDDAKLSELFCVYFCFYSILMHIVAHKAGQFFLKPAF